MFERTCCLFPFTPDSFESVYMYVHVCVCVCVCVCVYIYIYRLQWSRGSVLAFSTQVRGFKPSRSRRIFKGEKILSTPSFGGEVKLLVPCRSFTACKRSLNGVEVVISAKLPDNISRPQFHLSLLGSLASSWTWRHLATKVGTSKGRGK